MEGRRSSCVFWEGRGGLRGEGRGREGRSSRGWMMGGRGMEGGKEEG